MAVIKKVKVVTGGNYTSKVKEASDGDNYTEEAEDSATGYIEKVKKVSEGFDKVVKFLSTDTTSDRIIDTGAFRIIDTGGKRLISY